MSKSEGVLDVSSVATLLGVKPATVRTMRARKQLPEPLDSNVNGGAIWRSEDIHEFIERREATPPAGPCEANGVVEGLPKVVDLFAGCGGLSLGLQRAGFEVLVGIDNWEAALDVYSTNMAHPTVQLDLGDVDAAVSEARKWIGSDGMIVGGPPCQDFSSAGKRIEGVRADLTVKFAETVKAVMPRSFIMENVERAQGSQVYEEALRVLREAGYGITVRVLNAAFCGVPQSRKRLFAIGVRGEEDGFLNDALDANLSSSPLTLREYFGDEIDFDHYYRHPRSYARRGVFSVDEPSPTIRGVNRPVPGGYPGHPGDTSPVGADVKPLTTQMRARIQTFPGNFYFGSTKTAAEQMIGNAVPVGLAEFVGRALSQYLRELEA